MKKKFITILIISLSTIIMIIFLELSLKYLFVKKNTHYKCYEKIADERIYINGKNCNSLISYFESKEDLIYSTDKFGNRVGKNDKIKNGKKKIFFVGDSFTFGALSNYKDTYPFSSVQKINQLSNQRYREVNKGVNGYQIRQVLINILKDKEINASEDLIVYGITPNDLFDLKNKNFMSNSSDELPVIKKFNLKIALIDKIKNSFMLKYFASIILKNDTIYNILYLSRDDGAGYIEDEVGNSWEKKYEIVERLFFELPNRTKDRMIILTIPQKIQINLIKNNEIKKGTSFDKQILKICKKLKIKCIALTKEIAQLKNTHFSLDGHMLPEANKLFGELLGKKIFESNFLMNK
jgi:hypothetical protein